MLRRNPKFAAVERPVNPVVQAARKSHNPGKQIGPGSRPMSEPAPSYEHGASDQRMIGETIGRHFDRTVARWPDRPALIVRQQGVRLTWAQLAEKVDTFAAGLVALGLQPGDRVGIWSPNNAEWVIAQ